MHNCTSVIISKGGFFAIARTHHQNHRKASTNVHLLLNKIFICFQCGGMLISTMFTALPEPLAMTLQFVLFWFSWLLQGVFYSFLNSFLLTATSSFYQFFLFFFYFLQGVPFALLLLLLFYKVFSLQSASPGSSSY